MARSEKRAVYSGTGTRTVACLACGVWVLWVTRPLHSLGLGSYSAGWGTIAAQCRGSSSICCPASSEPRLECCVAHPMGTLCMHRF